MSQVRHESATTTAAVRRAIQHSQASLRQLSVTAHHPGFQDAGEGSKVPPRSWPMAFKAVWPWSRAVPVTER
jgi:hypothetical protein